MNVSLQSKGIEPILNELRRMVTSPVTIVDFVDNKTYGFLKSFDIDTKQLNFTRILFYIQKLAFILLSHTTRSTASTFNRYTALIRS